MTSKLAGMVIVAALGIAAPAFADTQIYFNDFSNNTSGFTGATGVTTAPNGEKFIGPLTQNGAATLTLNGVQAHSAVSLSFTLYGVYSLDGNGTTGSAADPFIVSLNGIPIFNQNFSNYGNGETQSYPLGGQNAPGAGSTAQNSLGYNFGSGQYSDTTYQLNFTDLPYTASTLVFTFTGASDQGASDEFYGIDNVRVGITPTATAVPGPIAGAGIPALFALAGFLVARRQRLGLSHV